MVKKTEQSKKIINENEIKAQSEIDAVMGFCCCFYMMFVSGSIIFILRNYLHCYIYSHLKVCYFVLVNI